jgi:hypothetical protein
VPSQISGTSHTSAAARHVVPPLTAVSWHVCVLTLQCAAAHTLGAMHCASCVHAHVLLPPWQLPIASHTVLHTQRHRVTLQHS